MRKALTLGALATCSALVGAAPAAGEESHAGSPTGGARGPSAIPKLASVACRRECGSHTRSASSGGRPVVHARSVLTIKGRDMQTVQKVVFLGGRGSRDDVLVSPGRVTSRLVTVTVPASASSGRVVALTSDGWSSKPTRTVLGVHRHAPPPPPPGTGGEQLVWPVRGPITGRFGEDRGSHYHAGIDISADGGTPIKAAAAGTVVLRGWESGYGNYTCVAHATVTTCYAHQSRFGTTEGAVVKQSEVIGYVGNTGNSRGNHLHFEVRRGTKPWGTPLDPMRYLP
ncbi:MAG: M23 family metallopeptidase [Actinomycetota bacterium]|nr:M23 family metallopeptidase [Actinomycetota bacterium]